VVVVPASATTPADLARTMVWGRAANGTWTSPTLAPGNYLVLASQAPVDLSVDTVERLFRARGRAIEANPSPGASVPVKLP
jgi:hypothetical protein